jgi:hypothetical protein
MQTLVILDEIGIYAGGFFDFASEDSFQVSDNNISSGWTCIQGCC